MKGYDNMELKDKVKQLHIGQEFKSYREVCEFFNVPPKGGKGKNVQLKEWARYFEHTKSGNTWIINKIYDEPLDKFDARSLLSGGSEYTDDLQNLILMLLHLEGNNEELIVTHNEMFKKLGLVNDNYKVGKQHCLGVTKELNVAQEVVSDFFSSTDRNLKRMIETAMNKLDRKSLIRWYKTRVIKKHNETNHRVVTQDEDKLILDIERRVMNELGCKDETEVVLKGLAQSYYNQVVMYLNNDHNLSIDYYYRAYHIVYINTHLESALNQIPRDDYELISNRLNKNLQNNLLKNAKTRQTKAKTKMLEYSEWNKQENNMGECPHHLKKTEIARAKDEYICETSTLIKNTIDKQSLDKAKQFIDGHYETLKNINKQKK